MKHILTSKPQQGKTVLSDFMTLLLSWEIPLVSINSNAGPMVGTKDSVYQESDWARHKRVSLPHVQCVYVVETRGPEASKAVREFAKSHGWEISGEVL